MKPEWAMSTEWDGWVYQNTYTVRRDIVDVQNHGVRFMIDDEGFMTINNACIVFKNPDVARKAAEAIEQQLQTCHAEEQTS